MLGGGYALVAIGYTLIFGVLNLLHLAHGEVAMIGSYIGLTLVLIAMSQVGVLPLWLVLIVAMIGAGVVGIVVELVAFRPLGRRQLHITPLITTIAVAFVLQEAAVKLFGSEQRSFPVAMFDELKKYDLHLGAFRITYVQMFIVAASLILGMIETMSVAYLVPAWKDGFAFGILILILLYKPTGLFGSRLQIEAGR